MQQVIVLNADYSFLGSIDWQRSIVLLYQNKAEIVKETDKIISNTNGVYTYIVPRVIRLIKYIKTVFKNKIPYSKYNVFLRDDFICQYCGKVLDKIECTIDHIVPKVKGGGSTWTNCITTCKTCNNNKGDKSLEETGYKLLSKPVAPNVSDFLRKKSKVFLSNLLEEL